MQVRQALNSGEPLIASDVAVTVFTTGASAVDGKAGPADCGWAHVAAAFSCTPTFESLSAQDGSGDEGSSADALSKSAATLAHIGEVLERQRVATGCDGGKADAKWRDDAGEDGTVCTVVEVSICPTHVSLYIDIYIYIHIYIYR